MVSEMRKQSMAWMEHGLQISHKRFALSIVDNLMAAWSLLGALRITVQTVPLKRSRPQNIDISDLR